jgi:hypothetical protein
MGCLASLIRFILRFGERGMLLYKLLRKSDRFQWMDEAQEAFDWLKTFLAEPPTVGGNLQPGGGKHPPNPS